MKRRVSVGEGNPLIPRSTAVTDSSDDAKSAKRQIGLVLPIFKVNSCYSVRFSTPSIPIIGIHLDVLCPEPSCAVLLISKSSTIANLCVQINVTCIFP